jgi:hypothetical protein
MVRRVGWVVVGVVGVVVLAVGVMQVGPWGTKVYSVVRAQFRSDYTVADRVGQIGPRVEPLWRERLKQAGVERPTGLILVGLKTEMLLHVWVTDAAPGPRPGAAPGNAPVHVATYRWTVTSGTLGPKLREGDRQIPEGFYDIESLHPNSMYHLALRVGYPSAEDRAAAEAEGRSVRTLGGDIMIHGRDGSVGCIALGDPAIEEVFWISALVGPENIRLLIAPSAEPRRHITADTPAWVAERYAKLADEFERLGVGSMTLR